MGAPYHGAGARLFRVFINGEERDAIRASSFHAARKAARTLYRVSCTIV